AAREGRARGPMPGDQTPQGLVLASPLDRRDLRAGGARPAYAHRDRHAPFEACLVEDLAHECAPEDRDIVAQEAQPTAEAGERGIRDEASGLHGATARV